MLGVGKKFPEFNLKAVSGDKLENINIDNVFIDINNNTYPDKWLVIFFYPKDFTFVCPTEIAAFGDLDSEFKLRNAQILAASIDSEFVHWAWRRNQKEIKDLPFPMLSDIKRELSLNLGVLDKSEGISQRATFIIDLNGIIRHVSVNDINVGRNPNEILRILDALQTKELCPCNWEKGNKTITLSNQDF